MIVKETDFDMLIITIRTAMDFAYSKGTEFAFDDDKTRESYIKWRNAFINDLLDAANIKTEESGGGCENGACEIHYKD